MGSKCRTPVGKAKQHIMASAQTEYSDTTNGPHGVRAQEVETLYHRRAAVVCCIMPGEMDDGGLAMRFPVEGFTMGIALVREERIAEGW